MDWLIAIIGPDKPGLSWWQESDRALIVFALGVALIRLSGLRTFSRYSPLDTVVVIAIGSNLSRVITGNAAFGPTLFASLVFVLAHRLLAQAAFHWAPLSRLLKGEPKTLIHDGALQHATMRAEAVTHGDLLEAIRLKGGSEPAEIERAIIERNGEISLKRKG